MLRVAIIFIAVFSTYLVVFLGEETVLFLCAEDGPFESAGAILFLVASLLFLRCYTLSSGFGPHQGRFQNHGSIFYLLLSIFFFFCFGEEISWGQRIFNWDTPQALKELNAQDETNLHNLWLFQGHDAEGIEKDFVPKLLESSRLFAIFGLCFLVFVPLANRLSERMRSLFAKVGLPVSPFWIGVLFVVHAVVFYLIYLNPMQFPYNVLVRLNELKEFNYAFIFSVLATHELIKLRAKA